MRMFALALMFTAAVATPAIAQVDPHQPANDGSVAASATVAPGQVAEGVDSGTAGANTNVQGSIIAAKVAHANAQAQYDADIASYDAAVQVHTRQTVRYERQKRAYADAMAAWRLQAEACRKGHQSACDAPAPNPASFY